MQECALPYKAKTIDLDRTMVVEVFKTEAAELGIDLSIDTFFSFATELV